MAFHYSPIFSRSGKSFYLYIVVGFCFLLIVLYNISFDFSIEISKPIVLYETYIVVNPKNPLHCQFITNYETLPDIQDTFVENDKSIFFLETTCNSYLNGKIVIKPRQACAVESAALMNKDRTIYLLFTSPGKFVDNKTQSDKFIKNLLSYQNVKIMHLNVSRFIKGTITENLWTSGKIFQSEHIVAHTSDLLRLLVLWKYGGIYLDLDVVVIKSFKTLPPNFAGAEDNGEVANGVLGFSRVGLGHQHLSTLLHDLSRNFDGSLWSFNGPLAIKRMLLPLCNNHLVGDMINKTCQNFTVMPPDAFYPIHYSIYKDLFDESKTDFVKKRTKNSYLIHVWNTLSSDDKIPLYKDVPYLDFARSYCPGTVSSFENFRK